MTENKIIVRLSDTQRHTKATAAGGEMQQRQNRLAEEVQRQAKLLRNKLDKVQKVIDRMHRKRTISKQKSQQKMTVDGQPKHEFLRKNKPKRVKTLENIKTVQHINTEGQEDNVNLQQRTLQLKITLHDDPKIVANSSDTPITTHHTSKETQASQHQTVNLAESYRLLESLRGLYWRESLANNNFNPEEIAQKKEQLNKLLSQRRKQHPPQVLSRKSFNLIKRDSDVINHEQTIKQRRLQYGESVSPIPKVDPTTQLAERIKLDKECNPAKYAILSKKGLSNKEIYWSKADYESERVDNRKSLGDQYLTVSKKRIRTDSCEPLPEIKSPRQQRYIDYLPVVRSQNKAYAQGILGSRASLSRRLKFHTEQLEDELTSKVNEFVRAGRSSKVTMEKQTEMEAALDRRLFQSIKAKLALAQLQ